MAGPAEPRRSSGCCARPAPSAPGPASTSTPRPPASTTAGPAGRSCSPATPSSTRTAAGRASTTRIPGRGQADRGPQPRHGPHRDPLRPLRLPPRARLPRRGFHPEGRPVLRELDLIRLEPNPGGTRHAAGTPSRTHLFQGIYPLLRRHAAGWGQRVRFRGCDVATCEVCGNDYWMAFEVRTVSGDVHTFDCFECAAHKLAPICEHCQVRSSGTAWRSAAGSSAARTAPAGGGAWEPRSATRRRPPGLTDRARHRDGVRRRDSAGRREKAADGRQAAERPGRQSGRQAERPGRPERAGRKSRQQSGQAGRSRR